MKSVYDKLCDIGTRATKNTKGYRKFEENYPLPVAHNYTQNFHQHKVETILWNMLRVTNPNVWITRELFSTKTFSAPRLVEFHHQRVVKS